MDVRDYLRLVRKRWILIVAFVVGAIALGAVYTLATPKKYEASARMFVALDNGGDTSQLAQGNSFAQARVQSYTQVATSPAVLTPVIKSLHLDMTVKELAGKVSADAPLNKVIINLHVTDGSPERAAQLANAVAAQFATTITALDRPHGGDPIVRLTVTNAADVPSAPISPKTSLNLALALILGLALGVGSAVLLDTLDNTVKTPELLNTLADAPILGVVPLDKNAEVQTIAITADPHGRRAEAYRQMRTNLQFLDVDSPPKIIAVTSAMPGEGKTTTALNLAVALAETGKIVCLIETDLRRPTIASSTGLVGSVGLTSVLVGDVELPDALQKIGTNLTVLTAGPIPPNPSELLVSEHARSIVTRLSAIFDYTILDTAPLLPVADGIEVATQAEAVLLVVRSGKTTREEVQRARESLNQIAGKPVGAVLSMAKRGTSGDGYYYYNSYGPRETPVETTPSAVAR